MVLLINIKKKFYQLIIIFVAHYCGNAQVNLKIDEKAKQAYIYCKKNKLNTKFCLLSNLSQHSGKNRFYIYDFRTDKVLISGLVCHGIGKNSKSEKPVYSNEVGSYCSSLGKYKIGKRGYFTWGIHIHYRMHGLEKSNSNAYKRQIVLHSYELIPESETYPTHLPMGWSLGCPVVSNNLMTIMDSLLKKEKKPTLIWIFE